MRPAIIIRQKIAELETMLPTLRRKSDRDIVSIRIETLKWVLGQESTFDH